MITYHGYDNCPVLENNDTRVVLTAHGARVLEYSFKGENSLWVDSGDEGRVYVPGNEEVPYSGGRLDVGPEYTVPPHPELWAGEWTVESTSDSSVRMVSAEDHVLGVKLIRDFTLSPDSSEFSVTQTIQNISDSPVHWNHWSRTFAVGGGMVFLPLAGESGLPHDYVMYGPGSVIGYLPEDSNIRTRDGYLEITAAPARPKLGMDSTAGWFAYLMKNDLLFVKRFPVYPDRVYGEIAGLTVSIYYEDDKLCELEPIGPRENIPPGASASFTEEWSLVPFAWPEPGCDVDLNNIAEAAGRE